MNKKLVLWTVVVLSCGYGGHALLLRGGTPARW